jgi:hypothetical protein
MPQRNATLQRDRLFFLINFNLKNLFQIKITGRGIALKRCNGVAVLIAFLCRVRVSLAKACQSDIFCGRNIKHISIFGPENPPLFLNFWEIFKKNWSGVRILGQKWFGPDFKDGLLYRS